MPFPVEEKYVIETEQNLDVLFPDNFKAKMLKDNGGPLETQDDDWQLYPFFDKSDKKRISRTSNHIALETKEARRWGNFPANAIAIASNGSGDHLVLLPIAENIQQLGDEIFAWNHETGQTQKVADKIDELGVK
ncbi:MAG: SMI1/KNR4 family protein [Sphingobacterium sp.]|jgi:hypothetical protein|nr:SMI1/KNR4 family protein [Sphingobacterium sp.]